MKIMKNRKGDGNLEKPRKSIIIAYLVIIFCSVFVFSGLGNALEIVLEPDNAQRQVGAKVRVHIYADSADSLISMGVRVSFNPAVLQVDSAAKDDAWVMDADADLETTDDQYTTPAVEFDNVGGTVTMIGGRLMGSSTSGLSGDVLLGWIVFEAVGIGESNLNVNRAKDPPFDNFVKLDAGSGVLDEPTNVPGDLGIICVSANACEGDIAEPYGSVDGVDFNAFRAAFGSAFPGASYDPRADLDGSGAVDGIDFNLFRADFGRGDCSDNCP